VQFDVRAVCICQSQNILLRSALQAAVSITRKKIRPKYENLVMMLSETDVNE
jgi:hypothetical protein